MDVKLTIERGPAQHRTIRLRSSETILGRQKGCDIRIPSAEISRRHCLLSFANGQLMVEDLDSVNGTFINDQRITGRKKLSSGDRLKVGPLTFFVQYPTAATRQLPDKPHQGAGNKKELEPTFELIDSTPKGDLAPIPLLNIPSEEYIDIDIDDAEPMNIPEGDKLRDFLSKIDH